MTVAVSLHTVNEAAIKAKAGAMNPFPPCRNDVHNEKFTTASWEITSY